LRDKRENDCDHDNSDANVPTACDITRYVTHVFRRDRELPVHGGWTSRRDDLFGGTNIDDLKRPTLLLSSRVFLSL